MCLGSLPPTALAPTCQTAAQLGRQTLQGGPDPRPPSRAQFTLQPRIQKLRKAEG